MYRRSDCASGRTRGRRALRQTGLELRRSADNKAYGLSFGPDAALNRSLCSSDSSGSCQMHFVYERFSARYGLHWRIPANRQVASFWNLSHRRSPSSSAAKADESVGGDAAAGPVGAASQNWNHREPQERLGDRRALYGFEQLSVKPSYKT